MTGAVHADHEAITSILDKVWVKVASHMIGVPVLELPTMDEDSGLEEEETTPAPRKRGLKSGKILTAHTTVLHQITWPHEVVHTSTVPQCSPESMRR